MLRKYFIKQAVKKVIKKEIKLVRRFKKDIFQSLTAVKIPVKIKLR